MFALSPQIPGGWHAAYVRHDQGGRAATLSVTVTRLVQHCRRKKRSQESAARWSELYLATRCGATMGGQTGVAARHRRQHVHAATNNRQAGRNNSNNSSTTTTTITPDPYRRTRVRVRPAVAAAAAAAAAAVAVAAAAAVAGGGPCMLE
ncbi:hypothetical protein E2C01_060973 [Portunus trituberculatus]|uniref:Uncharacterized protein n=1 Tax=Portunus trituberculatus TaxID=210409 RepID=A0A5B7H2M7_PORTR|nr:hypothetical protein [Portunus trituberculatus]